MISALVAVLGATGGCEFAIGDTVPAFYCNGGPNPCPPGQVCDTQRTHTCVPNCNTAGCSSGKTCDQGTGVCLPTTMGDSGGMPEVSVNETSDQDAADVVDSMMTEDEGSPPMETGPDTMNPCPGGIKCSCGGDSQCNSKLCVDQLSVGTGLYQAAGSTNFCSQPCCISADCPAGTVCYATGQGGNYCVDPTWIGRSSGSGAKQGGDTCSLGPRDCRSGLCDGSGHCVDTCCSTGQAANECAGSTTCTFGNFPGANSIDKNFAAYCGSGGNSAGGSSCSVNSECQSNLCNTRCANACRNTSDCTGSNSCEYVIPTMTTPAPIVAACYPVQGSLAMGATCDPSNDQCKGFCDPTSNQCTGVCFTDTDCSGTVGGWRCRNETVAVQAGGSYSVLCCGP
ncbi:MAG TPA: hypothetical protein VF765_20530 [Polyangiaceae bacterium]